MKKLLEKKEITPRKKQLTKAELIKKYDFEILNLNTYLKMETDNTVFWIGKFKNSEADVKFYMWFSWFFMTLFFILIFIELFRWVF